MAEDEQRTDRRMAERVAINTEFGALPEETTYVSDLSERGVFVYTREPQPVGAEIELRFTALLDDPVTIVARGKVVRHQADPPGMGIEFGTLDPSTILKINDVVSQQQPLDPGKPRSRREPSGPVPATDVRTEKLDADAPAADSARASGQEASQSEDSSASSEDSSPTPDDRVDS